MSKPDPLAYVMPGVQEFQYDDMRHYVRDCADRLGLRDWTAQFYITPPEDLDKQGVEGAVNIVLTRRCFTMWLPPEWFAKAGERASLEARQDARDTVAHELLHCHFKPIDTHLEQVQTNLGDALWELWHSMYIQRMEIFMDTMANPVAQGLPLPRIPAKYTPENASGDAILKPEDV